MNLNNEIEMLLSLVNARAPCGQEEEIRNLLQTTLKGLVDELWIDSRGNLIGKISGQDPFTPAIRLMVHMDEISMIVKRINNDGTLRIDPLGGILPCAIGQCPVDILGDQSLITGILSFGSLHISKETSTTFKMVPEEEKGLGKVLGWEDVCVITRKSPQELKEAGIHPGTRVVIGLARRQLQLFQDCIAGYFLDNRAALVTSLLVLRQLNQCQLKQDVYFVATCSEEIGGQGGLYAARMLPGDLTIAIDVGPVAREYQTEMNDSPIIVFQDTFGLYDKKISTDLYCLAERMGLNPQCAIWKNYGSDASIAQCCGHAAQTALVCFPIENTHGFEIIHKNSMRQCAALLTAYLTKAIPQDFP
jgi:putative aminopeptidase FrvX